MVGEFKDDRVQSHAHGSANYTRSNGAGGAYSYVTQDSSGVGPWLDPGIIIGARYGATTRGKQKGVIYIIKVL